MPNPNEFAKRFYTLFTGAMGIPKDAPIEELDISYDNEEDDESNFLIMWNYFLEKKEDNDEEHEPEHEEEQEEKKSKDELWVWDFIIS